jgi:RNA polymerase sigma-70 factor, ECF subfamily
MPLGLFQLPPQLADAVGRHFSSEKRNFPPPLVVYSVDDETERQKVTGPMSLLENEREAIEDAQRDPACFGVLYEANFHRVYAYLVRRLRDRSVAEDLAQEVFREALANIRKFEWRGTPFSAWLLRIASNAAADYWQRAKRQSDQPTPDEPSLEETERSTMLFQLVDLLPAAQQRVIQARFVEQKTIREIAEEMDRSEGAVKQLQLRAIENLRASMEVAR